jgi:hypothetical protein
MDTAAIYESAVAAFRSRPNSATHVAMVAAYSTDLAKWETEKRALDSINLARAERYDAAMREYEDALTDYEDARLAYTARASTIASLERVHAIYQQELRNYNEVELPAYQQYVRALAGYSAGIASMKAALMAQSRQVAAQYRFALPAGYPSCISRPHQEQRAALCEQHQAQFVRGLGATEADATGAWAGIPHCGIAALPVCPTWPTRPATVLKPTAPRPPAPIPAPLPLPVRPTRPATIAELPLRPKPEPPPPLPPLPPPIELVLPPRPDPKALACRPGQPLTVEERDLIDAIGQRYGSLLAAVDDCRAAHMPTIVQLRNEGGPISELEAARRALVQCAEAEVNAYRAEIKILHAKLSELCARLNEPPPPEPPTPSVEVRASAAEGGFGAGGWLLLAALAIGGYAVYKRGKKKG